MSLLSPTDDVSLSETGISTFLRNDTDIGNEDLVIVSTL